MRIIVGGPPHSGKSVLLWEMKRLLPIGSYMPIRAAPDGEGDWTQLMYQGGVDPLELRKKGGFDPTFVEWAGASVRQCTARFGLIDVGGKTSSENERICKEADAIIILSSDDAKIQEWVGFADRVGLRILAVLHSTLEPIDQTWQIRPDGVFEGTIVGLDRKTYSGSKTLESLVQYLLAIAPQEEKAMTTNTLTIAQIASLIHKEAEDYSLPNGREVHGLNWRPEDLKKIGNALAPLSALGTPWLIDGPAPQWLVVCLLEALHPCPIFLADSKVEGGRIAIGQRKQPTVGGRGELSFQVEEKATGVIVHYESDAPVSAKLLPDLVPPEVLPGTAVLLNGRTATWAVVEIASCYQHTVPAIYVGQPTAEGYMYVCSISHSQDHLVGAVLYERDL